MTSFKYLPLFIVLGFYGCGQNKNRNNPAAIALNDKIVPLARYLDNPDSCKKALDFLDNATTIDSTCFICHFNKLMFQNSLKRYDQEILTINRLIRLTPSANDLYLRGGMLYFVTGDTASSEKYFQKSLKICNNVLDTMRIENRDYVLFTTNKAINLIMLGDQSKGNEILVKLYNKQTDSFYKHEIALFMNKSKDELLNLTLQIHGR